MRDVDVIIGIGDYIATALPQLVKDKRLTQEQADRIGEVMDETMDTYFHAQFGLRDAHTAL